MIAPQATPPNPPVAHTAGNADLRAVARQPVTLPARLTWKDRRGVTRFASVVARDVSELGVYVESLSAVGIPLYRLVDFQLEREARGPVQVPPALRRGRVLSAVYRVTPPSAAGRPHGLALRLMVEPTRCADEAAGSSRERASA
jgi:hypothetical protein